jgi:hypothetical protein
MRTKPAIPEPQGKTPMERMDGLGVPRTVLKVSKADMVKDDEKNPKNHSIVEEMDAEYGPLPLSSKRSPHTARH